MKRAVSTLAFPAFLFAWFLAEPVKAHAHSATDTLTVASSAPVLSPAPAMTSPVFPASPSLSFGAHMRYAQPLINFGLGAAGHVEYSAPGEGRPGVEASYGRFGVSASGNFLTDPANNLWRAGRGPAGEARDIRTRYHGDLWGFEAHHLTAQGFDVSGRVGYTDFTGRRPDVRLRAAGATVYRSFDPDSRVYRLSEGLSSFGGEFDVFLTAGVAHAGVSGSDALLPVGVGYGTRFYDVDRVTVTSATVGGGFALMSNLYGLYFDQALFGGYGPQYRTWGERSDIAWNLAKVNLRVALGLRTRWFDVGVGVEDEAYASLVNSDRMVVHALAAQAKLKMFL